MSPQKYDAFRYQLFRSILIAVTLFALKKKPQQNCLIYFTVCSSLNKKALQDGKHPCLKSHTKIVQYVLPCFLTNLKMQDVKTALFVTTL